MSFFFFFFFQITETKYSQQSETDYLLTFCGIFHKFLHFMAISHGSHSWKSLWNSISVMPHRCDPYGQKSEQSKTVTGTFSQLNWFPGCCTSSPGHPQEAAAAWQLSALDCKGGGGHGAPLGGKNVHESRWEGTRLHLPLTQHPRWVSPMLEVAARGQQGGLASAWTS